jgi:adenosylhomocysteine nucleosidase
MIGIIGAMDVEVENIRSLLQNKTVRTVSGIDFTCGTLFDKEVVIAKCGIGKVFAAVCAQTMILEYKPDCIINTGVAGSLSTSLSICDVAVSAKVVQHDMDTSPIGDPVGLLSGINIVEIPADSRLASLAEQVIREQGINTRSGIIASGDQFIASKAQKDAILKNFDAIACEMEGASIGHVAYINSVPFVVLRAISDTADNSSHMDYPSFLKKASENSTNVTLELIKRI